MCNRTHNLEVLVCSESLEVLDEIQVRDGLRRTCSGRNLDRPFAAVDLVGERNRLRAVRTRALGGPSLVEATTSGGGVEPVEAPHARASSVPALGARPKEGEDKGRAGVVAVSLALRAAGEVVELGGEAEAGGERAADGAAVGAPEGTAAAGDGAGVALVGDCLRHGGDGEERSAESGESSDDLELHNEMRFECWWSLYVVEVCWTLTLSRVF